MICINCFHVKTHVGNSRPHKNQPAVWRRRHCNKCGIVFTSYERPALDSQSVLNHNSTSTPFNIGKLVISVSKSFQHDKFSADHHSLALAQTIETKLLMRQKSISVDDIATTTHETLKQFDPIAAIQYAAQHDLVILKRRPGRPSTSY